MAAVIDVVASEAKKEAAREPSEEAEEAEEEAEVKPRAGRAKDEKKPAPPFLGSRPKFDWEMSFAEQAYMCICVNMCIYMRICVYVCMYMCAYVYTCMCMCAYAYMCIYVYMCVYAYTQSSAEQACMCMHAHVHRMHSTTVLSMGMHMHMPCALSHTEQVRARSMHELNVGTSLNPPDKVPSTATQADEEIDREVIGTDQTASVPPKQSTRPVSTTGPKPSP